MLPENSKIITLERGKNPRGCRNGVGHLNHPVQIFHVVRPAEFHKKSIMFQSELLASYRSSGLSALTGLSGLTSSTLDRHTLANRTTSLRRMRHLLELEAKHQADRAKIMEINPAGEYIVMSVSIITSL